MIAALVSLCLLAGVLAAALVLALRRGRALAAELACERGRVAAELARAQARQAQELAIAREQALGEREREAAGLAFEIASLQERTVAFAAAHAIRQRALEAEYRMQYAEYARLKQGVARLRDQARPAPAHEPCGSAPAPCGSVAAPLVTAQGSGPYAPLLAGEPRARSESR